MATELCANPSGQPGRKFGRLSLDTDDLCDLLDPTNDLFECLNSHKSAGRLSRAPPDRPTSPLNFSSCPPIMRPLSCSSTSSSSSPISQPSAQSTDPPTDDPSSSHSPSHRRTRFSNLSFKMLFKYLIIFSTIICQHAVNAGWQEPNEPKVIVPQLSKCPFRLFSSFDIWGSLATFQSEMISETSSWASA